MIILEERKKIIDFKKIIFRIIKVFYDKIRKLLLYKRIKEKDNLHLLLTHKGGGINNLQWMNLN